MMTTNEIEPTPSIIEQVDETMSRGVSYRDVFIMTDEERDRVLKQLEQDEFLLERKNTENVFSNVRRWLQKKHVTKKDVSLPSDRQKQLRERSIKLVQKRQSNRNLQVQRRKQDKHANWLRKFNQVLHTPVELNYHQMQRSKSIEAGLQVSLEDDDVIFESAAELNTIKSIVIDIAFALNCYGIASHRLDYYVQMMSLYYGICCDTWANPMGIWITFGEANVRDGSKIRIIHKSNHFARVRASGLNLTKLHLLEQLATNIFKGKLSCTSARQELKSIISASPVYDHFMLLILSRFFSSIMFSIFFNANLAEVLVAAVAGVFSGLLAILARNFDSYSQVNVICTGIVSGSIAILFKYILADYYHISAFVVSLAGVISLIPGFGIAVSVLELSAGYMVAGSCRLISSFLITLQIAFGALVSHKFATLLPGYLAISDDFTRTPIPLWIKAALFPINIIAGIISQRAPIFPMSILFTVVTCYCSFFISSLITQYVHSRATATFVASVVVGIISNAFGWISQKYSGIIISSVGITFLLPGSLGFRSIHAFFMEDRTGALEFITDVITVCLSLTIGLLVANVLIPSKKKLRW